jgi:hypothetical protein
MIQIEFVNVPEDRVKVVGPFPWMQVTYEIVRVGEDGETEIAYRDETGYWIYDNQEWTDFIVSPA